MKTFLTLFKTALNINFGISALKYRFTREKRQLWEPIMIGISAFLGVGTFIAVICLFMLGVFMAGKAINQPELVLTLSLVGGQLIILIFGIFYIMGSFYFARDLNILIPLPLKPSQVLGSKFAVVMFNEYLTLAPFLLPAFIIYGAGTGQGILYWLKSIVVFLSVPAIPLIVGALFILLLMRFVNVRKSKDLFAIVGGFVGLLAAVGFNFFFQSMPKGNEKEFLGNILTAQSKIIELIGDRFPPSLWATYGLSRGGFEGLGYLLLFIGISLLLFAALLWLGNQVFYKSFISGQEISRKRKVLSGDKETRRISSIRRPMTALFLKEWKLFIRTPIYVMNGISGMVIAPFALIMPFLADKSIGAKVTGTIQNPEYALFVSLGALGIMLFSANINIIANTSVSREGQMFWISKLIPVPPRKQVQAKLLHCMAVESLGIAVTGIVLVLLIKMSVFRVLVLFIISVICSMLFIVLNLMIDVVKPKLEWTNPQDAVKRNLNGVFGMLITFFIIGVLFAAAMLMVFLGLPEWGVLLGLTLLSIAFSVPSVFGLYALAEHSYSRLEV